MKRGTWSRIAILLCLFMLYAIPAVADERDNFVYPPGYPQFICFAYNDDPRVVILDRSGAGPERASEFSVFELLDKGHRLRKLYATTLRNFHMPLMRVILGGGRFLVTFDEWEGSGTTENCLVIYDLALKNAVAKRLEDFVPADVRSKLETHGFIHGYRWHMNPVIDYKNLMVYPTSPKECTEFSLPFFEIDVRSQTVAISAIPASLPPTAIQRDGPYGHLWEWSMGNNADPKWSEKFAYPRFLKVQFNIERVSREFKDFLEFDQTAYYELDSNSGDYIRCESEKWVPRPKEPRAK